MPSEAMTTVSPMWKQACITLFSRRADHAGRRRIGASLKRISISTLAPSAVELDRLLAAAVEEQIGLDLHRALPSLGLPGPYRGRILLYLCTPSTR